MHCYNKTLPLTTAVVLLFFSLVVHAVPPEPEIATQTPANALAGEQFCFDTVLTNIANGDPGFSPYYRLILPPDISLNSVSFLGTGVSSTLVGVFAAPGNELTDPVIAAPVSGNTDDTFYTISLPVGSVVTGGPDLTVNFCMTIDNAASIGTPLDIIYQPVYALGDTATGDNGPIIGATVTDQVTPTLIIFDKQYNGPESERTPGPSFPFTFTLTADVANGKTVENLVFNDTLPADLQFVGPITISGGTGCSVTATPSVVTPGGSLSVSCASVTGTTSDHDVTVTIPVYVIDTLDETNCVTELKTNTSTLDFDFPAGTAFPQLNAQDQLTTKHLAIQKSVSPGIPATAAPGNTVTYTNTIQLSDYTTAADALVITDTLPDGTTFAAHTSLVVGAMTVPITPTVTHNADGTTTVVYDVHAVTGDLAAGATATLIYTATIDQSYESPASPVLAADTLTNTITADYSVTANNGNCSDSSAATILIEPTAIRKTILNQQPEYLPGEVVTYRLEMDIPSGDTSNIVFKDFFPLPVFDVSKVNLTFGTDVIHSPGIHTLPALIPVITSDATTNSLILSWPDVSTAMPQTLAVDIAITVENEPFADSLALTNLFVASSENTINTLATEVKPVQFNVRAPSITLTKGIAATTNGNSTLSPAPGSPVDSDLDDADAGDTVTFVVTAENTGGAPAYQLNITDPTVSGLTNCSLVSVTDGTNALAFTPAAATSLASGIELDDPVPANGLVLATVTCDIDTAVSPQQISTNTASATWRSQSGATEFPAATDDAIITIAQPSTEKTIESVVPGLQLPAQVTAGDVLTYRLKVTVPEGNTENLILTDTLPAGFLYQSAVIDSTGFNGTASIDSTNVPVPGQTVTVTMAANTSATADNDTTNNSFSVLVTVLVDEASADNSAINTPQQKTNTLSLDYTGRTGTISSSVSTQFVEPSLALTKTMSPDRNREAGDTITITLAVTNNGSSPAYDIVVTDILNDVDNLFDLATVAQGTTPAGYTYSLVGGNTVTYSGDNSVPLASGDTVTFTFTAKLRADIETGSSFDNTASIIGDSQPGVVPGERTSTDTGTDTLSTRKVRNKKIIISSSEAWTSDAPANTEAAIGEIVRYQVTVRVPEGSTTPNPNLNLITDRLPIDFEYQPASATIRGVYNTTMTEGGNLIPTTATAITPIIAGRNISFNLGTLQNNDFDSNVEQIIIEYDALVLNTARNNAGDRKTNRFRLNFLNADGNPQSSTARRTITLVEPQLSVTKQAQPSSVQGGTQTTFTVVLSNQAITNSTRAWEPVISDQLPADYLNPQIVSATLSRGGVDISACASFTGNLLSVDSSCLAAADRYLDPGETYTVVYTADVTPTVQFEQPITNTASATVSSLPGDQGSGSVTPGNPGDNNGERNGSGAGSNDLQASAQATVIADKPTISKSGDAALQIGETTTMTLMIGVP
ncbi:MAG TPA: isopeptide-forming domain-containing fimbrial protein, partial [Crenotrichaceae bacterium]|nr:isopeptide-forming domain-containing fimbrial protein [Crenotrichaceae bacterium]